MMRAAIAVVFLAQAAHAQSLIDPIHLSARMREMSSTWSEKPLDCSVTPVKPSLNFAFRLQTAYSVRVPMDQYFGPHHQWIELVRVTPRAGDRKPVFLGTRTPLPDVPKNKVEVEIGGGFLVGEGIYDVRWMMWDDSERICRKDWTIDAHLSGSERAASVGTPPNTVDEFSLRGRASPPSKDDAPPFRVSILMHAAPLNPHRTRLRATDQITLISSLSSLLERLPARSVHISVFNLEQQTVLYRSDDFTAGGIPAVARALNKLELDRIDYHTLLNRGGHLDLLADLVRREIEAAEPSDAVVFLGPEARFLDRPPRDALDRPSSGLPRFFFFQYKSRVTAQAELPDTLTLAVNRLKGKVMTIRTPAEFARAIHELEKRATGN